MWGFSQKSSFINNSSDDALCFFESKPSIISKIVAVGMEPELELPIDSIEVVFDHVFVSSFFLYDRKF